MSETAIFMSPTFLSKFIGAYKSRPCLWNRRSLDWHNKPKRTAALRSLLQMTRTVLPDFTMQKLRKKIDMLRGTYRKELKKVRRFEKIGADKPHVPKLWYFKQMLFLQNQDDDEDEEGATEGGEWEEVSLTEAVTVKGEPDTEVDDPLADESGPGHYNAAVTEPGTEVDDPLADESGPEHYNAAVTINHPFQEGNFSYPTAANYEVEQTPAQKRPRDEESNSYVPREGLASFSEHKEDEYDKIGANVAAKLRRMDPVQRIYAEHLISEVMFKGMLSKLSETSCLASPIDNK